MSRHHRYLIRSQVKKKRNPLTHAQRQRIITLHSQNHLPAAQIHRRMIAAGELVTARTIRRLILEFKRTGEWEAKPSRQSPPNKTPKTAEDKILEIELTDNSLTGEQIKSCLDNHFASDADYHSPSLQTIYDILHRHGQSNKGLHNWPTGYNSYSTKQKRWTYVHDLASPLLTAENTIYVDETPFASHQKRSRGWSPIGVQARRNTSVIRGINHSVIAAISPAYGLIHYKVKRTEESLEYDTKGVGATVFKDFVKELLQKPLLKDRSRFFFMIMDNVNLHKNPATQNLINRHHRYTLLPPYSPFLNPIEYVFGNWKSRFKSKPHTNDEEVAAAIDSSSTELAADLSLFLQCYEHTKKYYNRILRFEDVFPEQA
jgi:transposase